MRLVDPGLFELNLLLADNSMKARLFPLAMRPGLDQHELIILLLLFPDHLVPSSVYLQETDLASRIDL